MEQAGRGRRCALLLAVAVLLAACQPVDEVEPGAAESAAGERTDSSGADLDLTTVEAAAEAVATEWDRGARVVELSVRLDADGSSRQARVSYVAPEADRMLVVTVDGSGSSSQELTLETLGFAPLPREAVASIPALPAAVVEPPAAVRAVEEREALEACVDEGPPQEVLYATGAPGAWDGGGWAPAPVWSLAVLAPGGGVRVNVDGTVPDEPCLSVP